MGLPGWKSLLELKIVISKGNAIPIAGGEHELDLSGFQTLVARECVDIVQADVSHRWRAFWDLQNN